MFLMLSDLLQNTSFPTEMLLGSAEGVDHTAPVDAVSTAPLSILTAVQPLEPEAEAAAAGEQEEDADAKRSSSGGERGARWRAAARGLLEKSIIAGSQPGAL